MRRVATYEELSDALKAGEREIRVTQTIHVPENTRLDLNNVVVVYDPTRVDPPIRGSVRPGVEDWYLRMESDDPASSEC